MAGDDLFLGAAQGETWPLSVDTVQPLLQQRFPDAIIQRRSSPVTGKTRLSFTIPFPDGTPRHGIYIDHDNLALSDGGIDDWADTIAWFLDFSQQAPAPWSCAAKAPPLSNYPPRSAPATASPPSSPRYLRKQTRRVGAERVKVTTTAAELELSALPAGRSNASTAPKVPAAPRMSPSRSPRTNVHLRAWSTDECSLASKSDVVAAAPHRGSRSRSRAHANTAADEHVSVGR